MLRHTSPGTLRCGSQLIDLSTPVVMGILNTTPDSFYPPSRISGDVGSILAKAGQMIDDGCTILDIGGMSSRPGAKPISPEEELSRVLEAIKAIHASYPNIIISIDTYRSEVARSCIDAGATMVNDISGGQLDPGILDLVAETGVAYVMMHMRGTPDNMQYNTDYEDVVLDLLKYFSNRIKVLKRIGIEELVIDPGFGFSKTPEQNYQLVDQLGLFRFLNLPVLIGVSRKSTLSGTIGRPVDDTLEATTALHMAALGNGASILRVHDVQAAMDTIAVFNQLAYANTLNNQRLIPK